MKLLILNNTKEMAEKTAAIICEEIKKKHDLILGLATGKTMIPLYKKLVYFYKKRKINFSRVRTFNLDEYFGIGKEDKKSLRYFMDINFFNKVKIKKENIHFLNGNNKNWKEECRNYESTIRKFNGVDLQILGIGRNGHIGFNEPGSSLKSRTRKVKLSDITLKDNGNVPRQALTIGIKTIIRARRIILLANGKHKADAIAKVINGKISNKIPASILKKHKEVAFIIDKGAASKLESTKD